MVSSLTPRCRRPAAPPQTLVIGLSVRSRPPTSSYWALAHGASQPDFHLRQSFALTLQTTT
jgi:hypothetical protein